MVMVDEEQPELTPLERRRKANREYQRRRRKDPVEREIDREYQRRHYRENRERILARMKAYHARKMAEKKAAKADGGEQDGAES